MSQHSDSDSSTTDPLDFKNEEGWEDVEPDDDTQPVVCLFSDEIFPNAQAMLAHCKQEYGFDLKKTRKDLGLDFMESMQLVNYVRAEVKSGNQKPDVSSKSHFEDEKYLKPTLEDDALLYSLDDDLEEDDESPSSDPATRAAALEEELARLRVQFEEYRQAVQKSMGEKLNGMEDEPSKEETKQQEEKTYKQNESGYFTSYAYNAIHESMLKDKVRTDAYRDFVYDNKHLFKDKVVLDVGCGTGILSMFCAKAGAKLVIAVDNSNIIDKAREIVYTNGLSDIVKCIRGKIEEVVLPVPKVDIIISEWMGYCLLFEAMFDSVIYARDHYLAEGGLMVPSHAKLRIAPMADPDLTDSYIDFWNSVYGFDMRGMKTGIYDEALVKCIEPSVLAGDSAPFLQLPLHTITVDELSFAKAAFSVTLDKDIDALDGWAIWFDMFFMHTADAKLEDNTLPDEVKKRQNGAVAFTTGPHDTQTHWMQGVFLIDRSKGHGKALKKGTKIKGSVGYAKMNQKERSLDIELEWKAEDADESGNQKWQLD